ncbi:atrial natriuretic peptide-converting enzyme isoform X2 [Arctopsyche grandis]
MSSYNGGSSYGGRRNRGRPGPGSTMSCDSDIRFTRRNLSSGCKCGCALLAAFFVFLIISGVCVYLGSVYLTTDPLPEKIFRGMMRAQSTSITDPIEYKERINLIYRRSELSASFLITEILALDRQENDDTMVHFNLHFDETYYDVFTRDVRAIMMREIRLQEGSRYLANLTIDPNSLDIQESEDILSSPVTLSSINVATVTVSSTPPPPPRKCSKVQLKMCQNLPYNITSYPNVLGHMSLKDVEDDMIAFRELIDSECYRLAYDFVCQLLQPSCVTKKEEDELILPCRSYCREFWAGCGGRLPERFRKLLDCNRFPEYIGPSSCRSKKDCVESMKSNALSNRICDGIPDCEDLSDEMSCTYCAPGYIHCGLGRSCLPPSKRCDGFRDCPNGSDEKACLVIAPNVSYLIEHPTISPHQAQYYSEGYVVFNEEGSLGKLCVGSQNDSETSIKTVASSMCNSLSFKEVDFVKIKRDEEANMHYVEVEDPLAPEISFLKSSCVDKKVMYVGCSNFDCGKQSAREVTGIDGLGKNSEYGDWPWHAILSKEDSHVCDATLISPEWLITTASCFQGQPKAEWLARLGVVRVSSTSPWLQERRIVGMVKSPVEGSTIVLIKMEEPVRMSDFVRPICLPKMKANANVSYCNTLGWTRNRDQLQRVHLRMMTMKKCENISIATVNSLCTEALHQQDDCNEEEFAGSPIACLDPFESRWSLMGVSNWRIACTKAGLGRPRMYDKITSNIEWIKKMIGAID